MNDLPDDLLDYIFTFMGYKEKYSVVIHQVTGGSVVRCERCSTFFPIITPEDLFRVVLLELLHGKKWCFSCLNDEKFL